MLFLNKTIILSAGGKMSEGPERKGNKQQIPDLSRTCLVTLWMIFRAAETIN